MNRPQGQQVHATFEAAALGPALDWIESRLTGRQDPGAEPAIPAPFPAIAAAFGLPPIDEALLLLALAADLSPLGHPPTLATAARLFLGEPRLAAPLLARVQPLAPLIAHRLLLLPETGPLHARPLLLPPAVRDRLTGLTPALPEGITPLDPIPLPPSLLAALETLPPAPALQLLGPPRSGRTALGLAHLARLGLTAWHAGPETDLAEAAREARLEGAGLLLDESAGTPACPHVRLLPESAAPAAGVPHARLAPLGPEARAALWSIARPRLSEGACAVLAEQFALGTADILALGARQDLEDRDLWQAAAALGADGLEGLAERLTRGRRLESLVFDPGTQAGIDALLGAARTRATVMSLWGFRNRLPPGITALFAGPSGTGKTAAAQAIATELGLDLLVVDLARLVSKYIGETEKNLARLFDAAESGGAILFFDEADALFGKRSEVKDAHDRYANQEVSYLLQRMERHAGIAILATNLRAHIDQAFLRRIRLLVDFPLPGQPQRRRLWERALPAEAPLEAIDWDWLARLELAGGTITVAAAGAAALAAAAHAPIGMAHLKAALAAEYRKLGQDTAHLGLLA
jgi:hypothetical protein